MFCRRKTINRSYMRQLRTQRLAWSKLLEEGILYRQTTDGRNYGITSFVGPLVVHDTSVNDELSTRMLPTDVAELAAGKRYYVVRQNNREEYELMLYASFESLNDALKGLDYLLGPSLKFEQCLLYVRSISYENGLVEFLALSGNKRRLIIECFDRIPTAVYNRLVYKDLYHFFVAEVNIDSPSDEFIMTRNWSVR